MLAAPRRAETAAPAFDTASGVDRRGPFRPRILAPTRLRLAGRLVTRLFQAGDGLVMIAAGWLAFVQTGGGAQSLPVGAAGGLAVLAALSLFDTYAFTARRGLMRHLSCFFKGPEGDAENDFFKQFTRLEEYVASLRARAK